MTRRCTYCKSKKIVLFWNRDAYLCVGCKRIVDGLTHIERELSHEV